MENRIYKKGDVVFVKGITDYKEGVQSGELRPYLIVSNDKFNMYAPVLTCVALTSKVKKYSPVHLTLNKSVGLPRDSTVLCEQIHTISKCDIANYVCSLPETMISEINQLLSFQLSI